jgi:hypothetical protein
MVFGDQVRYAAKVLDAHRNPFDAGPGEDRVALAKEYGRVVMQIVVSLVALATGVILLLKGSSQEVRELGSGFFGTVLGYWLR